MSKEILHLAYADSMRALHLYCGKPVAKPNDFVLIPHLTTCAECLKVHAERAKFRKTPIAQRIEQAFGDKRFIGYRELALKVFPEDVYPCAWRHSVNGGPPGCYMALSSALRRFGYAIGYNRSNMREVWKKRTK